MEKIREEAQQGSVMPDRDIIRELIAAALEMRKKAYCPYSGYSVGAALLAGNGKVFGGCNIENASFGDTVCAERCAMFKAVYDGKREFTAIAVIGSGESPAFPCGICRQVMAEFCEKEFLIITANCDRTAVSTDTLAELLPHSFGPKDLL